MLSKYKAIIFDWDGTLVDTCALVLNAHNHVRTIYGQTPWTMDDFLGSASLSAREYYPKIYGDKAEEAQAVLYQFVEENHLIHLKEIEYSVQILEFLKNANMPVGVVSNKRHAILHKEIEHLQWAGYFKTAIGAGHAAKDKPDSAPLLMAIHDIDPLLMPADILYIGDTETDLITAKNTQCPVALIQSDKPRPDLIDAYRPDYAWATLLPLLEAMQEAA